MKSDSTISLGETSQHDEQMHEQSADADLERADSSTEIPDDSSSCSSSVTEEETPRLPLSEECRESTEEVSRIRTESNAPLTRDQLDNFLEQNQEQSYLTPWFSLNLKYGDGEKPPSVTETETDSDSDTEEKCTMSDLESQVDTKPYEPPQSNQTLILLYFKAWTISAILLFLINCANMNWRYLFQNEPWWMIVLSITFFIIQGALQWSVLELPLMSFVSCFVKGGVDQIADGRHLTVLINYNLLASYKSEVDATMVNAFAAYIGNLGPSVASVLVSATGDEELKAYELQVRDNLREQIFDLVLDEGKAWARGQIFDQGRAERIFEPFRCRKTGMIADGFVRSILPALAEKYAKDFMVVQRITRGTLAGNAFSHSMF
jgi:hypothetical protein